VVEVTVSEPGVNTVIRGDILEFIEMLCSNCYRTDHIKIVKRSGTTALLRSSRSSRASGLFDAVNSVSRLPIDSTLDRAHCHAVCENAIPTDAVRRTLAATAKAVPALMSH
jgi:hypothetical protein